MIIPAYQAERFVGDAIDSALDQTAAPAEVIVCDDGSTDATPAVLASYGDRIRVIRKPNGGLPSAKNTAAREASGDFVAILDADDIYLPERLEALGELAASRPDLDILATDLYLEAEGRILGRFTAGNPFVVEDQRKGILTRNFIWSGAAVRRRRLLEVGGFDETVDCGEDWDCWRRLIFSGSRIGMVDEPLAHYRLRPGSMTSSRARDLTGRVDVLERAERSEALTAEERAVVHESLRQARPRAALAAAREALREGRPDARARARAVIRCRELPAAMRLKAVPAAIAPRVARRVMSARGHGGRAGAERI